MALAASLAYCPVLASMPYVDCSHHDDIPCHSPWHTTLHYLRISPAPQLAATQANGQFGVCVTMSPPLAAQGALPE